MSCRNSLITSRSPVKQYSRDVSERWLFGFGQAFRGPHQNVLFTERPTRRRRLRADFDTPRPTTTRHTHRLIALHTISGRQGVPIDCGTPVHLRLREQTSGSKTIKTNPIFRLHEPLKQISRAIVTCIEWVPRICCTSTKLLSWVKKCFMFVSH